MKAKAFTLIELLIVVAIIAILAAIAVPNFLEAQARAKISRAKAEMRSLSTAVESYQTDNNEYPQIWTQARYGALRYSVPWLDRLIQVTTPIAYISTIPDDLFDHEIARNLNSSLVNDPRYQTYVYNRGDTHVGGPDWVSKDLYLFNSAGPDNNIESTSYWEPEDFIYLMEATGFEAGRYDPSNGTISRGDIFRWGPGGETIN